jgi:hypothetical protein
MAIRASLGIFVGLKNSGRAAAGIIVALALLASSEPALADDPLLKQIFDRQAAAAIEAAKSPHKAAPSAEGARILVLADGRVVDGAVRADLHGYRVETPDAKLFFTFDQVQLVARDRADAYQKMRAWEPGTSVRRDMRLGRWCLENRLPNEAAFHLRKVLDTDPTNQEAKNLLARLEADQTRGGFVKVEARGERVSPDAKVVESLARLSPDTVKDFVIGVQPILLSRCGNARCHGPATENSFHLERVHLAGGGSRLITGRNLDSSLREIDPQFARRSALYQKAIESHGGTLHAPLSGGGADVQKARLLAWLTKVAPEVKRLNQEDSARRSVDKVAQSGKPQPHRDAHVVPASATSVELSPVLPSAPALDAAAGSGQSKSADRTANDLGPLTDPFDPSQFNRGK